MLLHCGNFHIRSPSPSPSTSSKLEPDGQDAPRKLMNSMLPWMVRTPPLNLMDNMLPWMF